MRRVLGSAVLALWGATSLPAQAPIEAALSDLRPPASPAFAMLGVEPHSIDRPKTPRALALSVFNATSQLSTLPKNYALEVAPYWLTGHPTLEFDAGGRARSGSTFLETLSFSLATSTDSAGATRLGIGARALLAGGRPTRNASGIVDSIRALQDSVLTLLRNVEDSVIPAGIQDSAEILGGKIKALAVRLPAELQRVGLRVEVAAAATGLFPGTTFDDGRLDRFGAWINVSYQLETPKLDLSGLLRVIGNGGAGSGSVIDYGGRVTYQVTDVSFAFELVGRAAVDAHVTQVGPGQVTGTFTVTNSSRAAGSLDFAIGEGSSITFSFGRDFSAPGQSGGKLLALLALNLGFGDLPVVLVRTTRQSR